MNFNALEEFAKEYNALLNKYNIRIVEVDGPVLILKETPYGAGYHAMTGTAPAGKWFISEPWGG